MTTTPKLWKSITQANTFDANVTNGNPADQFDASVVGLPNGGYAVFWTDFSMAFTAGSTITGQLYSPTGQPIGGEVEISDYGLAAGSQSSSAATLLTNNNVAVAWVDLSGGVQHVWVTTTNLGLSQHLTNFIQGANSFDPSITALAGGAYLVTYTLGQNNDDIVGNIVDASGNVGADVTIDGSASAAEYSQAATLTNGNAVVVYQHNNGTDFDIYYDLLTPAGASASGGSHPVAGGADAGQTESRPSVAALHTGGFVVAWQDTAGGLQYDIHASIYNNAGNVVVSDLLINSAATTGNQFNESVVALQDGFAVTWGDYNNNTVVGQRFDDLGHQIGSLFTVGIEEAGFAPSAALLNDGRIAYGYDQFTSTNYNVFTSIWTPNLATPTDFNKDVYSDILFQNSSGAPAIWLMNGTDIGFNSGNLFNPGPSWHVVTTGDFNGDFRADILWQNTDGTPVIWEMDGTNIGFNSGILFNPGPSWKVIDTGDFNGDGKADILWQNSDGTPVIWQMDGTTITFNTVLFNPGPSWKVIGTGDFNADGQSDILFQNSNGTPVIWEMHGSTIAVNSGALFNPGSSWKAIGTRDFNADGHYDNFWQNTADTTRAIWEMNGTNIIGNAALSMNPGPGWHAIETGDFNRDGKSDLVLHNDNGQIAIWEMDGTNIEHVDILGYNPGSEWHIV
jgi:hypothetical protein